MKTAMIASVRTYTAFESTIADSLVLRTMI